MTSNLEMVKVVPCVVDIAWVIKKTKRSLHEMSANKTIADAKPNNWVDRLKSRRLKYLFRLARFDRPVGVWLLLWPCFWGIVLATPSSAVPNLWLFIWFFFGAMLLRSAGCAWNDIVDRKLDAVVERTAGRPLAQGHLTLAEAYVFLVVLLLLGFLVLLQLQPFAVVVGLCSLALAIFYPYAKRLIHCPQLILGLAFNWGVLVAWSAVKGQLDFHIVPLYVAGVVWTIGYDTIYAHQDKKGDTLAQVKSSALFFGEKTRMWLWGLYGLTVALLAVNGLINALSVFYYFFVMLVAGHFAWQIMAVRFESPHSCLRVFRSNTLVGGVVLAGLIVGKWF